MSSYQGNIQILTSRVALVLALASAVMTPAYGVDQGKFRPYPDEWEWFVPVEKDRSLTDLHALLLDSGEVLVRAELTDASKQRHTKSWLLFSKRTVDDASIDAGQVRLGSAMPGRIVGAQVVRADIGNDSMIENRSRAYRLCFRGPARNIVVKSDRSGHTVAERVIFVILDQPREFVGGGGQSWAGEVGASCPDEGPVRVRYQVAAAAGTFLSLPDGTTLMVDPNTALILRLRDDLQPGKASPSRRVHSLEYSDDDTFVSEVLGKDYLGDGETPHYQEMLDDLYNYLTQRKSEQ